MGLDRIMMGPVVLYRVAEDRQGAEALTCMKASARQADRAVLINRDFLGLLRIALKDRPPAGRRIPANRWQLTTNVWQLPAINRQLPWLNCQSL